MRRLPAQLFVCLALVVFLTLPAKSDVAALNRAHALYENGELAAALSETLAAKQAVPADAPQFDAFMARALWQEAQILSAMGDLSGALNRADESVEHASNVDQGASAVSALYRAERGKILLEAGSLEKAQGDFLSALSELEGNSRFAKNRLDVRRHLALALIESGQVIAAHDHFQELVDKRRALGSNPALVAALIDLASAKLRLDADNLAATDKAARLIDEALDYLQPQDLAMKGELEILQGRVALQRSELAHAEAKFSAARAYLTDPLQIAHAQLLEAEVNMLRGRAQRAERLYTAALGDIERRIGKQHPILARNLVGLGIVSSELGRPSEAIEYLLRAIRVFEDSAGIGSMPAAEARVELAMIFNGVSEYESARSVAGSALEALSEGVSDLRVAYAHSALGFALSGLGENEAAMHHLETAVREIGRMRGAQSSDLIPGLIRLASVKTNLGKEWHAEAAENMSAAFRIIRKDAASGPRLLATAKEVEIRLLSQSGKQREAMGRAREAILYLGSDVQGSGAACDVRAHELKARHSLLTTAVDMLAAGQKSGTALISEMFHAAQYAHTGTASSAILARSMARNTDESTRKMLTERARYTMEFCALNRDFLRGVSGVARGAAIDRKAVEARLSELLAEIAKLEKEIGPDQLPSSERVAPPSVKHISKHLRGGEGMLLQLTGKAQSHLFWIDPEGLSYANSMLSNAALAENVQRIRKSIQITNLKPGEDLPAFPLDAAHALYTGIFAPFARQIAQSDTVFFIPDGAARSIPASVLLTKAPDILALSDPEALAKLPWFGTERTLAVLPSPEALIALREEQAKQGSLAFVGVGNPKFARESYALPETETELKRIRTAFAGPDNSLVVLGEQATESFVRASPAVREARILAFATHGLVNQELGATEPSLMLTPETDAETNEPDDGFLTASEIATLDLSADLVILSACNTAAGLDDRAEGLSGLASGFFRAGARSLIVSHWYVPSDAAAALTVFTAEALAGDAISRPEALRRAMDRVRKGDTLQDSRNLRFGHPAYWAPFVLVGETG